MMTGTQPLPFCGLFFLTLIGCSALVGNSLTGQEPDRGRRGSADPPREQRLQAADPQSESQQQPRRRDQREEGRQGDAGQSIRPGARVVPPGPGWDGTRWVLGITTQTTSTGVRVRRVVPGSPASRVGLERDDLIVTVDGYQVGRVGSRHYPLGDELQFRAGRRGEVLLLVQNRRNDRLVNLPVQLTRRAPFDDWPRRRQRQDDDFFEPRQQDEGTDRQPAEDAAIE